MLLPREPTGVSLLASALSQDLWPTALLLVTCVVVGAVVTVVLVTLAGKEDRVDAIRAAADLLNALLPWRARRGPRRD